MHNKLGMFSAAGLALAALMAAPTAAWGQAPVVSALVDAASYAPTGGLPGAIVTIFGTNLAAATATAQSYPLPRQLGGATVTWSGIQAPLFYVSPTQINLQVPWEERTAGEDVLVVSTAAGNSATYSPAIAAPNARGGESIFSMNASGYGQGAVLNDANDGTVSVNSTSNSASPGEWISVYGTGVGLPGYLSPPQDGTPAPLTPLFEPLFRDGAVFDIQSQQEADIASLFGAGVGYVTLVPALTGFTNMASSSFYGLAPGYVGLTQTNVQIPTSVREGCAVPIRLQYSDDGQSWIMSQPVTIAIRQGGGSCVDPPAAGYGQIIWQKTVHTAAAQVATESDTLTVSLQSSPGMQAPAVPRFAEDSGVTSFQIVPGLSCPVSGYRSLAAGTVTAQGPGLTSTPAPPAPLLEGQVAGLSAYQATIPSGSIQAGTYTVAASGGADVGAFLAAAQIGADIQIQTPLAGTTVWGSCQPLTINWTGGDPNSWITMRFIQGPFSVNGGIGDFVNFGFQVRTSDGTLSLPFEVPGIHCTPSATGESIVLSIEVDPDPSELTTFSAYGLSLGGQATWRYVHTFDAYLNIQ